MAAPLWPMVPADLRARALMRIPASLSPDERLRLGDNWINAPTVPESCNGRDPQEGLLSFLAGWSLLEELAWSSSSDRHAEAAGLLYARLRKEPFISPFREGIRTSAKKLFDDRHGEQRRKYERDFEPVLCLGPATGLIASHARALERHFAAEILRGAPSDSTARVLRDEAARRSEAREFPRALPLAAEVARLDPRSGEAWLALARVSYQTDDVASGDQALGQALALGADPQSPAVREATRFQSLAHAPSPQGFEPSVSRFRALFEMGRLREARSLLDTLRRQRPDDARLFVGDVWLTYLARADAGGWVFELGETGFRSFADTGHLTHRDADYYRTYLALAFQAALKPFMVAIVEKRPLESDPAGRAAIARARILSRQLAPDAPDDAALYALVLDIFEAGLPTGGPHDRSTKRLGQLFPRALAVYAAHPCRESYRLVLGLAVLTDDWSTASTAIKAPLRFDHTGDSELALTRARAFLTAAVRAKDWKQLQGISTLLAAVPRWSDETNSDVDVLRADAEMLRAVNGEKTLWREAARGYNEVSWTFPAWDKERATNNTLALVNAFCPQLDRSVDWSVLRNSRKPDWPVLVNGAAEAFRAGHPAEALAILRSRALDTSEELPDFVSDWLACLEGAPSRPAAPPAAEAARVVAEPVPAVDIVSEAPKPGDVFPEPLSWQFSTGLSPPDGPVLSFWVNSVPWLIVSPRLCWAARTTPVAAGGHPPMVVPQ